MSDSRTRNAKRNIIGGVVNKIVVLGLPFVIRTIILWKLGAEYLGLSSLFNSILQVLNMVELGFSSAVIFSLYKPIAEKDEETICALMALYRRIYKIVGIVVLIVGLGLLPFLKHLISGTYPNDINLNILYLLYLINTVISYLAFAYKSVLFTAAQRQDVISNADTVIGLVRCVIQIAVLLVSVNYYLYIIWNPIFTLIYNIIISVLTKKSFPKYVCRGQLDKEKINVIVKQIKGLAFGKISYTTRNTFDSIVLSSFCGLTTLAIYSNYYYIFSAIAGFLSVLIQSITAGIGNSIAIESLEKNYRDFRKLNFYYGLISSWCTICLVVLYQPFMKLWVGNELTAPFGTMVLFCIYFYITQMGQIRSAYASAAGIWWEFRHWSIAEMILNLLLNFLLGRLFGMNGVLWATIITVFLFSIIGLSITTFKCYFKRNAFEFFSESGAYALITAIAATLTYLTSKFIPLEGYLGFVVKLLLCFFMPNILMISIYIQNKQLQYYLKDVKNRVLSMN